MDKKVVTKLVRHRKSNVKIGALGRWNVEAEARGYSIVSAPGIGEMNWVKTKQNKPHENERL